MQQTANRRLQTRGGPNRQWATVLCRRDRRESQRAEGRRRGKNGRGKTERKSRRRTQKKKPELGGSPVENEVKRSLFQLGQNLFRFLDECRVGVEGNDLVERLFAFSLFLELIMSHPE